MDIKTFRKRAGDSRPTNSLFEDNTIPQVSILITGAHNDDEGFVYGYIHQQKRDHNRTFGTVILTNGAGSNYQGITGTELVNLRTKESRKANGYMNAEFFSGFRASSAELKSPDGFAAVVSQLEDLISRAQPEEVLVHSPLDDHSSHQASTEAVLTALRNLDARNVELWAYGVWTPVLGTKLVRVVSLDKEAAQVKFTGQCYFPSQNSVNPYPQASQGLDLVNFVMADAHTASTKGHAELYIDMRPLLADSRFRNVSAAQYGGGLVILSQAIRSDPYVAKQFEILEKEHPDEARIAKLDMLDRICIPLYTSALPRVIDRLKA